MEHIVSSAESRRRKMLLCDTVNAYAPLDESQRVEAEQPAARTRTEDIAMT